MLLYYSSELGLIVHLDALQKELPAPYTLDFGMIRNLVLYDDDTKLVRKQSLNGVMNNISC